MIRRILVHGLALALMAVLPAFADDTNRPAPGEGRYYVEFHRFGPEASRSVRDAGGRPVYEFGQYRAVAAWLSDDARGRLQRNPNVQAIEVDPQRFPMSQTVPYGVTMVQAPDVSAANADSRKLCVIDSGYYRNHEDLASTTPPVTGDSDSGTGNWFEDGCGHGTHVAGTISALNNSTGVLGVAPGVRLHIVKVFGSDCSWTYSSSLINALGKCRNANANVVSMSLGGGVKSRFEESAFNDAYTAGLLSVAAAGNGGNTQKSYPASYNSVVSVAAVDSGMSVASFSQQNDQVELAAPGVAVQSTVPWLSEDTLTVSGTTYVGSHIENSPTNVSLSGALANGALCDSVGSWSGKIVLCERGSVSFYTKVANVQNGGGAAAVIYNNAPGNFLGTLGDGYSSTIPAISLSQADGQTLVATQIGQTGSLVTTFTKPGSGYEAWDGTSMATPHVSAVAALVWSQVPGATNQQIRDALDSTALDRGVPGRDFAYGYGIVQAKAALDFLGGGSTCTPTEAFEVSCSDGLDNDCDGAVDANDTDCQGTCSLGGLGASCTANSQCCSNTCKGKPGKKTCK